jgi:hypothetical protein
MTVLQNLKERHLNLSLHRPIISEKENTATFILYTLTGSLVGYHQYRPNAPKTKNNCPKNSRYYTYKKQATHAVFGLESLSISNGVLYLTEGIFDCARLTYNNKSAIAALCNSPTKDFKNFLMCLSRPVVAVCDSDHAGSKLSKFADYVEVAPKGNDLGSSPDSYVHYLLNKYMS